ncbi:Agmatinase [Candidatus Filomicrobium marinum]|uniref:Agmatinase n=1 Tax=Candidatus Filomicrobium marinum TaxID=1608628 RepID=A0A0D6JIY0_9HYPH|nr:MULTISPECIES: agmatinase [Filomicrobium]MCV0370954.1 agmatinase [Filomicrobium sp.]CFX33966.1 Agmatinase [Candidatus Filomicrobium marinum]CPR21886.1 Agmatinase [Candidatus Filomicrobium marinum]
MGQQPSDPFTYLHADEAFLDPDRSDVLCPHLARALVIPFGLEATVSYGSGTARGPAAILAASHQLELYDDELMRQPCDDFGIATLKPPMIDLEKGPEPALDKLARIVEQTLEAGRFPFVLGGEHSLTAGAIRPFAAHYDNLVVLQFDAHADLRDGYLGERFSHAAAMRRVLDYQHVSLVSVGIRAVSAPEVGFAEANKHRVHIHWGKDQAHWSIEDIVAPLKGRPIYVTFDIDGLDGSIMPATGTPTPGGMNYPQALAILRRAAQVGTIVGADLVELAPIPGFHAYDFLAAQLAYKMMAYALSGTGPGVRRSRVLS